MERLVELSCLFVERWEYAPFEPVTFEDVVEEMGRLAADGFFEASHVRILRNLPGVDLGQIREIAARLRAPRGNMPPLEAIAAVFGAARAEGLWRHSLEVAHTAKTIAALSGRAVPDDAFLAGLLHDVGRLAMTYLNAGLAARHEWLIEQQVECVFADLLVCGFDHAAAGAEVLRWWRLPAGIIHAVERHHQPEASEGGLASALSLAEHWSGSQEDLPSLGRIRFALDRLGLEPGDARHWETVTV